MTSKVDGKDMLVIDVFDKHESANSVIPEPIE